MLYDYLTDLMYRQSIVVQHIAYQEQILEGMRVEGTLEDVMFRMRMLETSKRNMIALDVEIQEVLFGSVAAQ